MYPGANFYGIKKTILKYAKLPSFFPLPVAVQHGWQRKAHNFEAASKPPEIWVWSHRIAGELTNFYPKDKIRVVGSFFCYFVKGFRADVLNNLSRRGSICIPPHSSHHAKKIYSAEHFAEALNDLPDEFKPIRVMLYYLDMQDDIVKIYERYGFEIVTNGELFDDAFLHKFLNHVFDKKYCIFSELGSGVLFSLNLGLKSHRLDISSYIGDSSDTHLSDEYVSSSFKFDEKFLPGLDVASANEELGVSCLLSSKEMRRLILKNYFSKEFLKGAPRRVLGVLLRKIGLLKRT